MNVSMDSIFVGLSSRSPSPPRQVSSVVVATRVDQYDVRTCESTVRIEDNEPRGSVFVVELPLATE